jgi:ferritin
MIGPAFARGVKQLHEDLSPGGFADEKRRDGVGRMLISQTINDKLNEQINNELFAAQTYLAMSSYFRREGLHELAKVFKEQANEEREHAAKFQNYIEERLGIVQLREIAAPKHEYGSIVEALEGAFEHEKKVSRQIEDLKKLADKEEDHTTGVFLDWFVEEQVEEVYTMHKFAQAARMAGPHIIMVEAYLLHLK